MAGQGEPNEMDASTDLHQVGEGFEQYLEAVYKLEEMGREPSTSALAEWLDVRMASVTGMLKRLQAAGLIAYESYKPAQLTDEGLAIALRIVRRHRLWEVFLNNDLGIPWYEVYQQACALEHATSESVELALERYLGLPEVCPHGFPIPDPEGKGARQALPALASMEVGQQGRAVRISERQNDLLTYLAQKGLHPGATFVVTEKAPFGGPITVDIEGAGPFSMSLEIAALIHVELTTTA